MHAKDEKLVLFERTSVDKCYQCGNCTAGCPLAGVMDYMPNQILRLVQMGELDKALQSTTIWLCCSCLTCSTRCPQKVDCAGVMDVLREMAVSKGLTGPEQQRIRVFHDAFLNNVARNGRVNEVELIMEFKTRGFLKDHSIPMAMKDSLLAPELMKRGKFHFVGEKVKDRDLVKRIFDRCLTKKKGAR